MYIPREYAKEIGCHPTHLDKINSGRAKPSPKLCARIIEVMAQHGKRVSIFDLRPDFKELVVANL